MSSPGEIRALTQRDLRFHDRLRRDLFRSLHVLMAPPLASGAAFERLLRSSAGVARKHRAGLFLGIAIARAHFRDTLQLEIPSASIDQRLPDWIETAGRRYNVNDYFLGAGDWSRVTHAFLDSSVAAEAIELQDLGLNFRQTEAYRRYLAQMQKGQPVVRNRVRLASCELVDAYFERFVSLFRSMESHGLVRHADLGRRRIRSENPGGLRNWRTEAAEKDIGVAIGANGEIYRLPGAQHRTAIALVMGIPRLPVEVRLVHVDWLMGLPAAASGRLSCALREGLGGFARK